jgi:mannose-6-phosphate isomerase
VYDQNTITNGPLAGQSLGEVTRQYGAELVGKRSAARYGADFPLLAKFIDAADRLSVQVHPDDDYAHRHAADTGFHGKTEAWYILSAAPGARVTHGLARPSNRAEFEAAVRAGAVETLLQPLSVSAGDVIFVPAGTVHAIGAGIVLFEIQQKSDLTYRVYDYDRRDAVTGQPRALHLDQALDVIDYAPAASSKVPPLPLGSGRDLLVACPYFALERLSLEAARTLTLDLGTFEILTVIGGAASLEWPGGALALARGDSVVVPAAVSDVQLQPAAQAKVLRVYVPDLEQSLLAPLRQQGLDAARAALTIFH